MFTTGQLTAILRNWATLVGDQVSPGAEDTGRELWPVIARDGAQYYLKRLSPWRNLPLADEARVLRWLSQQGVDVAEFLITDQAALFARDAEDSFVLIPRITSDRLNPAEVLELEEAVGRAIAGLHLALAAYPWPANSYTERLADALLGDLLLPPDVAEAFAGRRADMAAAIRQLPVQLVHGDLTPENILLRRPAWVAGFIDFDHLPLAPRIWDLARYLSRRLRLRWQQGQEPAPDRLDYIGRVIYGYHRTSRLTDAELNALPASIAAGNLIEASYGQQLTSGLLERRRLPDHDEVLADTIEAARWHLANYSAVEDAVQAFAGRRR
jgi:Ser/Thr protein kinase RdoA (MazF antagonist)